MEEQNEPQPEQSAIWIETIHVGNGRKLGRFLVSNFCKKKVGTVFRRLPYKVQSSCYSKYKTAEPEEPSASLTSQLAAAMTDKRQQTGQKAGAGAQ